MAKKQTQKSKRSTATPRAGTKRTSRGPLPAPRPEIELPVPSGYGGGAVAPKESPAPAGDSAENPLVLEEGQAVPAGVRYVRFRGAGEPKREANRDRAHRWESTYASREALDKDTPSHRSPESLEEFHPAALEQFEAACLAVFDLLDSGVVGDDDKDFVIAISGQGNTGHKPTNGQPNDALTIVIRQRDKEAT